VVELLRGSSDEGRVDAVAALVNLAGGYDATHIAAVVTAGAIPLLVDLLRGNSDEEMLENVTLALGNLACSNNANAAAIEEASAIPLLVGLLLSSYDDVRANAERVLAELDSSSVDMERSLCWLT
jgi:intracellular sulfur oxidation DsrE/DsrF family protein